MGILIALAVLIFLIVSIITKPSKNRNISSFKNLARYDNKTKHSCKCYMEGLTLGEWRVADLLARELDYKDYFLFNNIILHSKSNVSTQIDHIIVSKFGIFVLENKELRGWIFGDKNQLTWTQSMPGAVKYKFKNPLNQNYGHIISLKELMPFAKDNFYNIVVLSGNAEFKTTPIENVLYINQLINYIKKYNKEKLNENQVQFAVGKLSYACQTINITNSEHVANIYANKNFKNLNNYQRGSFKVYY